MGIRQAEKITFTSVSIILDGAGAVYFFGKYLLKFLYFLIIMSKIIIPPTYLQKTDASVIFLAGPIQGTNDWQSKAIEFIKSRDSGLYITSPRRNVDRKHCRDNFSDEMYNEQIDWETYHLRKAGETGAILFWLAKEFEHCCSRAYAQTTRFELGEWKVHHERDGANLVIGIEDGYTGAKYIRRRLLQDCPDVTICSILEETCDEAIKLARSE